MDRLFRWYWRRRARVAKDPASFHRLVLRRRAELDRIAERAEAKIASGGETSKPDDAIWSFRPPVLVEALTPSIWVNPDAGLRPARGLSVYHDSHSGAFTLGQRPNRAAGLSRFELFYESYEFGGGYLSLAIAIPDDLRRPKAGEVLRCVIDCAASRKIKTFFRLNIASARQTDVLHDDGVLGEGVSVFDFDLAYAAFEPGENDQVWLDIIFDRPRMVEISLRDLRLELWPRESA